MLRTTTVFLLAAQTFSINSFCFKGSNKESLSFPSVSQSEFVPTIRIVASDSFAKSTAAFIRSWSSGANIPICTAGNLPSHLYSTLMEYSFPDSSVFCPRFGLLPILKKVSPGSCEDQLSIRSSPSIDSFEGPILNISKSYSPLTSGFIVPLKRTLKEGFLDLETISNPKPPKAQNFPPSRFFVSTGDPSNS